MKPIDQLESLVRKASFNEGASSWEVDSGDFEELENPDLGHFVVEGKHKGRAFHARISLSWDSTYTILPGDLEVEMFDWSGDTPDHEPAVVRDYELELTAWIKKNLVGKSLNDLGDSVVSAVKKAQSQL